jgi:spore germination cell wall hydrolase CwlJ-like protein
MLTDTLRMPAFRLPNFARKHGITSIVLFTVLGLNLFAGISLLGVNVTQGNAVARVTPGLPSVIAKLAPAPEPLQFRSDVAPQDALAINASVPIAEGPNPAARPFALLARTDIDKMRSVDCLTQAIYYEAATESDDGKRAVAQVVLNRVRHPAYPNSVCGVVYQGSQRSTGCQFTFTCDGALARGPMAPYWQRARAIAQDALAGKVFEPVGWATHYHTNWVVPYWSSSLVKVANVGTHIFYRWTGGWGRGPAFTDRHAGSEPDVTALGRKSDAPVALAEGELKPEDMTPDQLAAAAAIAEKAPDGTALPPSSVDSFQRAVLRRYEPMPGSAVKSLLASQARSADKAYSSTHVWAMSGEDKDGKGSTPLGKPASEAAKALGVGSGRPIGIAVGVTKPVEKTAEAKPAQPRELDGVRKAEPAKVEASR